MTVSDSKLKQVISRAIVEEFTQENWIQLGLLTGTSDLITGHSRLLGSLRFGDNDYQTHAATILSQLLQEFDAAALLRNFEEIINLPAWLRETHPDLFRDVYESEFDESLLQLEHQAVALGASDTPRHIARIRRSVDTDPEQAIGSSKELLESVLKTILGDYRESYSSNDDLAKLLKDVRRTLALESGRTGSARDRVLNGLSAIAAGVAELRNLHGTGHGRGRTDEPDTAYAHLAVNSSTALAHFLIEMHKAKKN